MTTADTAAELHTGDVSALATPRLIELIEQATVEALEGQLGPDDTTVSVNVAIDHVAPVAVGHTVRAEVVVSEVQGRRITFTVSAKDERGLVAAGKVTRVVIARDKFMAKLT
ncbi:MAG: hypothetical protein KatS3mg008_1826 [Acidimicrobiales bacterium]|nr:MAG: hypothetical protein KatS3mg008_1826 [Acidimicrobiales bacterium]